MHVKNKVVKIEVTMVNVPFSSIVSWPTASIAETRPMMYSDISGL